jgi:hypothetical protein
MHVTPPIVVFLAMRIFRNKIHQALGVDLLLVSRRVVISLRERERESGSWRLAQNLKDGFGYSSRLQMTHSKETLSKTIFRSSSDQK